MFYLLNPHLNKNSKFSLRDQVVDRKHLLLREAFQSKKERNLGISPNRGGSSKNQKSPKFQLGKVQ